MFYYGYYALFISIDDEFQNYASSQLTKILKWFKREKVKQKSTKACIWSMKVMKSACTWGTNRVCPNRWSSKVLPLYEGLGSFNFERQWYHDGIVLWQFSSLAFAYLHLLVPCSTAAGCVSTAKNMNHVALNKITSVIARKVCIYSICFRQYIYTKNDLRKHPIHECRQKCSHFVCHAVDNVPRWHPHIGRSWTAVLCFQNGVVDRQQATVCVLVSGPREAIFMPCHGFERVNCIAGSNRHQN